MEPQFCETPQCFHEILGDVTLPGSTKKQKSKPLEICVIWAMRKAHPTWNFKDLIFNPGTILTNISQLIQASFSSTQKDKIFKSHSLCWRCLPRTHHGRGGTSRLGFIGIYCLKCSLADVNAGPHTPRPLDTTPWEPLQINLFGELTTGQQPTTDLHRHRTISCYANLPSVHVQLRMVLSHVPILRNCPKIPCSLFLICWTEMWICSKTCTVQSS